MTEPGRRTRRAKPSETSPPPEQSKTDAAPAPTPKGAAKPKQPAKPKGPAKPPRSRKQRDALAAAQNERSAEAALEPAASAAPRRIWVSGANGFVGKAVVRVLR